MRIQLILGVAACFCLLGCENSPPVAQKADERPQERAVNLPPAGIGSPLRGPEKLRLDAARFPDVFIDQSITGDDRAALQSLLDESRALLTSPQFTALGTELRAQYPRVWTIAGIGYRDVEQVAAGVASAPQGWAYAPTRLLLWTDPRTGARDSAMTFNDEQQRDGNLRIRLGPTHLERWRSNDPVERSCAVNTLSHEITHTILSRMDGYFPVFIDGQEQEGNPPRVVDRGTYGTYLVGGMAQCLYLQRVNRINARQVQACIPVWTARNQQDNGPIFASSRCDDFRTGDIQ